MNELKKIFCYSCEVSKEVFLQSIIKWKGRSAYQIERDQKNGLLHYDAWDTEDEWNRIYKRQTVKCQRTL